MTSRRLSFGYHPWALNVSVGPVTIAPLSDLAEIVAAIESSHNVDGDWIYAPPRKVRHFGGGSGGISYRPYPSRIFGLPKTHIIEHASPDNDDHLVFHLWALSFFTGMRLTSTGAEFVDATPIKPGKLVDFMLVGQGLADAVELTEAFWVKHRSAPERAKLFSSAVHALFLGQNPRNLEFERFMLLYTAFDACFALAKSLQKIEKTSHNKRISEMCSRFGMPVPVWADPSVPNPWDSKGPEIAFLRNDTVHEGLFMDHLLGFAVHRVGAHKNLTLEMQALICRLLIALLGGDRTDYVVSPVNTRQYHGLSLA